MLLLLASLGLHVGAAPSRVALANAVDAYHQQSRDVRPELRALLEQRPWDDDVAFWLARAELDNSHCIKAAELLYARDGVGIPSAEFRAWQAQALTCTGDLQGAWEQGLQVTELDPRSVVYAPHNALMGLLSFNQGQPAQAAAYLHLAGGSPELSLASAVRSQVPQRMLGVKVLESREGSLVLKALSSSWRLDLRTGLMQPFALSTSPPLPARLQDKPGRRSMGRRCALPTWASPAEPLVSGASGIFELRGDRVEQRVIARPGEQLEAPVCDGEELSYLRRAPGRERPETTLVHHGQIQSLDGVPVSFDVGPGGLVVALLDGRILVGGNPTFETALALREPRWSP
ncbi:MAG: hypothetical protein ACI9VR_003611 [Cognaticolwellia sp.]|jgi:hypothetical protein